MHRKVFAKSCYATQERSWSSFGCRPVSFVFKISEVLEVSVHSGEEAVKQERNVDFSHAILIPWCSLLLTFIWRTISKRSSSCVVNNSQHQFLASVPITELLKRGFPCPWATRATKWSLWNINKHKLQSLLFLCSAVDSYTMLHICFLPP